MLRKLGWLTGALTPSNDLFPVKDLGQDVANVYAGPQHAVFVPKDRLVGRR